MWFSPDISPSEVPATFQRFAAIIGTEPWIKRYRALRAEQERNPLMRQFIDDRHSLELSLGPLVGSLLEFGTVTPEQLTDGHYGAVSFVTPLARIYKRVSESGRRRIQGMLRDGLNSHRGLLPFRNELETATHLMLRGFDVAFSDIETGGGFDFLARGHGAEFEVECKSVSGDFGRKIHRGHMLALSRRLQPVLQEALGQRSDGQIVRILLPSRLHADAAFFRRSLRRPARRLRPRRLLRVRNPALSSSRSSIWREVRSRPPTRRFPRRLCERSLPSTQAPAMCTCSFSTARAQRSS